jgi:mRNA interferase MazF
MTASRGDVVLAWYPFASGQGGKRRPCLVVQGDAYNQTIRNVVVTQITSNLQRAGDPAHLLIEANSPEGQQSGLLHDSLVSCINLATIADTLIDRRIGSLTDEMMKKIDDGLKAALAIA